jgi:hypothetical protein
LISRCCSFTSWCMHLCCSLLESPDYSCSNTTKHGMLLLRSF